MAPKSQKRHIGARWYSVIYTVYTSTFAWTHSEPGWCHAKQMVEWFHTVGP